MRDITDLIAEAQRNLSAVTNNPVHSVDLDLYRDVLDALEAVTVPTENERERLARVIMDADFHTLDYERKWPMPLNADGSDNFDAEQWEAYLPHADAILDTFRLPVPVEPEWEYRRRSSRGGLQPSPKFDTMPALNDFEWAQRRSIGEWEDVPPDEITEGGTQ